MSDHVRRTSINREACLAKWLENMRNGAQKMQGSRVPVPDSSERPGWGSRWELAEISGLRVTVIRMKHIDGM